MIYSRYLSMLEANQRAALSGGLFIENALTTNLTAFFFLENATIFPILAGRMARRRHGDATASPGVQRHRQEKKNLTVSPITLADALRMAPVAGKYSPAILILKCWKSEAVFVASAN